MNLPRLALVAALAALLSGCYAYGSGPYIAHYGGGYAYQGAYRQAPSGHAPSGHAYDEQRYDKPRLHRPERRHRSAAREPDRRGSADRKAEPQPAPAEGDGRRDAWRPGPTARDEGPRPGAEGGAR